MTRRIALCAAAILILLGMGNYVPGQARPSAIVRITSTEGGVRLSGYSFTVDGDQEQHIVNRPTPLTIGAVNPGFHGVFHRTEGKGTWKVEVFAGSRVLAQETTTMDVVVVGLLRRGARIGAL